ncbi:MAG TPA: hypothetical protein QF604_10675 [Candidatus Latescibacteria bacterium]|jgi:hypothetical protein|nr:hypothetical protein [Candidatus Latescibacterota bacterium]MDP7632769.1 hypothetical protein [Candidatus Latescibacterota bacterium]MEC8931751.1 hypothetical protein [Candidatus Latescibacterota bacterium]MED5415216.1 hypothetical protein [Candidatus Latescibacterota bacterium]MEE3042754.1 hypothetical protein [Candidatus Latescibacterota bacterium]|tara:strand:+ start:427 stop:645 length:219 start_codon:yes stop_codon:yes gene_type:complete
MESDLHTTLKDLMASIASGDERVRQLIGRVDELHSALPADTPTMLRHYLEKRSYAKALDFLEGRDEAAAANC